MALTVVQASAPFNFTFYKYDWTCSACGGQKMALEFLELELLRVMMFFVSAGNRTRLLYEQIVF